MRLAAVLFGSLLALAWLGPPRRANAQAESAQGASDAKTAEARRHFRNGIRLYEDKSYATALAEFEAAYDNKPSPGSLQNVALCQKALLRYAEAADTLALLLERHGSELSDDEKAAARLAKQELEATLGSLTVAVEPPHAKVSLDGRALDPGLLGTVMRANAGDHALVATAPGYTSVTQSVRVVAGAPALAVKLVLVPVMGFLAIEATDPSAVVAIDGRPVGMGGWTGPVEPGEEHLVQVYRSGYEPFETRVAVGVGETKRIAAALGAPAGDPASARTDGGPLPPPPETKPNLGWYSIAGLNLFGRGPAPLGFDTSGDDTTGGALSVNLRLGRHVKKMLGVEMLLDAGTLNVDNACDTATVEGDVAGECGGPDEITRNYQRGWFRFGPLVRLTTTGRLVRVGAGAGAGLVWHQLRIASHAADENRQGGKAAGWDAYGLLEVGVSYHIGHLSIGLDLIAQIDGASSLDGRFDGVEQRAFARSDNALPTLGIGLRAGYSQWGTEKKPP